ncbi:MAG: CRISPR-associated endoribonuclease Cas6 [Firmicutes bacterium]|nr:CRISPR-associated endoribonuclease Cas6 [Bacillota bacterium]
MHLTFYFNCKQELELPIHYNHLVQAALYNSIDSELAAFLHSKGYAHEKRTFKMFSFSRLQGNFKLDKKKEKIIFEDKIKLTVSSPVEKFCESLTHTLLTRGKIRFGSNELEVSKVHAEHMHVDNDTIKIVSLSPIVLYSTLFRPDGRKYTCYYQPLEPDYNILLTENLKKKYRAFWNSEPPAAELDVQTINTPKLHIVKYKGTIIKGYSGKLLLSGPQKLLQMAVDAGLGSKNSQGFGCVKLLSGV